MLINWQNLSLLASLTTSLHFLLWRRCRSLLSNKIVKYNPKTFKANAVFSKLNWKNQVLSTHLEITHMKLILKSRLAIISLAFSTKIPTKCSCFQLMDATSSPKKSKTSTMSMVMKRTTRLSKTWTTWARSLSLWMPSVLKSPSRRWHLNWLIWLKMEVSLKLETKEWEIKDLQRWLIISPRTKSIWRKTFCLQAKERLLYTQKRLCYQKKSWMKFLTSTHSLHWKKRMKNSWIP